MQQLGNVLTRAREEMGLSIEEVAQNTKIRAKYIQALEQGNIDEIPGKVYALGFLKSYCELLQLDYKELQEYFNANYQEKDEFVKSLETAVPEDKKAQMGNISNKRVVLLALLGACILFGGITFFVSKQEDDEKQLPGGSTIVDQNIDQNSGKNNNPDDVSGDNQGSGNDLTDPNQGVENNEPIIPPVFEGIVVTVEATGNCWTSVAVDDGIKQEETLYSGDIRTFTGLEKVVIKFGNAGAVKVTVNGELQEAMGTNGQVITKEFVVMEED